MRLRLLLSLLLFSSIAYGQGIVPNCPTGISYNTSTRAYSCNTGLPIPPSGAVHLTNLQNSGGGYGTWTQVNSPSQTGSSTSATGTYSLAFNVASPSLSGSSMKITSTCTNCGSPNTYYYNTLSYLYLGCTTIFDGCVRPLNTNFLEDFWLYVPSGNAGIQALEYDPDLFDGSYQYLNSQQCDLASGMWRLWNMAGGTWITTSYPCNLYTTLNTWHHYQISGYYTQASHTYTYMGFVLDGVTIYGNLNQTYSASTVTGSNYNVQVQIGSAPATGTNIEYIDEMQIWLW